MRDAVRALPVPAEDLVARQPRQRERAVAGPGDPAPPTPIRKPTPPEWFVDYGTNAEMRWDAVGDLGYAIPNERFFVRNHTSTPTIDAATWRLRHSLRTTSSRVASR